jgi:hypothetical protein
MKRFALLTTPLILLLLAEGHAQTLITNIAGAEQGAVSVTVERFPKPQCEVSCVLINYTLCLTETSGCVFGWQWAESNNMLTGNVGASWTNNAVLTLKPVALFSGTEYGQAWYCYAWYPLGECSDMVEVDPTTSIGSVSMQWTKTPVSAGTSTLVTLQPGTTSTEIWDIFTANVTGSINGVAISASGTSTDGCCSMVFSEYITSTNAVPPAVAPSDVLAGKLSPAAIKQLKAIEARRLAK